MVGEWYHVWSSGRIVVLDRCSAIILTRNDKGRKCANLWRRFFFFFFVKLLCSFTWPSCSNVDDRLRPSFAKHTNLHINNYFDKNVGDTMSFMNASDIRESAAKWKGLLIVLYRPTSNVSIFVKKVKWPVKLKTYKMQSMVMHSQLRLFKNHFAVVSAEWLFTLFFHVVFLCLLSIYINCTDPLRKVSTFIRPIYIRTLNELDHSVLVAHMPVMSQINRKNRFFTTFHTTKILSSDVFDF